MAVSVPSGGGTFSGPPEADERELVLDPPPPPPATRSRRPSKRKLEAFGIFAIFAAVYFAAGYRTVVELNVVNFDSLSRMAHAYFVLYNDLSLIHI